MFADWSAAASHYTCESTSRDSVSPLHS